MNKTKIEWVKNPDGTQGYTWNPITGCLNGCEYCYARKLANTRLKERYLANGNVAPPDMEKERTKLETLETIGKLVYDSFHPRFWEDRLKDPIKGYKRNKGIFVCDMSDLFGIGVPEEWTRRVLDVMKHPWLSPTRFYLLTKQPQNLAKFSPFPDNCWVGVTATDSDMFDTAFRALMRITAKVKYISFEPLLDWTRTEGLINPIKHLDWVIIGAQTKPYKPPKIEWVQEIVEAADRAGVKVFLKNNLYPLLPCTKETKGLFYYKHRLGELRQEMPR